MKNIPVAGERFLPAKTVFPRRDTDARRASKALAR
jgi:hypothetical protein